MISKQIASVLFFLLFLYSGKNKISNFSDVTKSFKKKTAVPSFIATCAIAIAVFIEVIGSLILIANQFVTTFFPQIIIHCMFLLFLLFVVLATLIYHPFKTEPYIFMKNLSLFAALLYMYADYLAYCDLNLIFIM